MAEELNLSSNTFSACHRSTSWLYHLPAPISTNNAVLGKLCKDKMRLPQIVGQPHKI